MEVCSKNNLELLVWSNGATTPIINVSTPEGINSQLDVVLHTTKTHSLLEGKHLSQ